MSHGHSRGVVTAAPEPTQSGADAGTAVHRLPYGDSRLEFEPVVLQIGGGNMHMGTIKALVLGGSVSLFSFTGSWAQAPTPSPSPAAASEGYSVTSSIELGVRGLSVNGDRDKYRSDLNYRAGFRIFDSSFLIENNSKGSRLFDSVLITTTGFGSDPSGSFRSNIDKTGLYKFDANVRRVRYLNNLKNHVAT